MLNKRLHGWVLQLLDFDFCIIYRPGVDNQDADALSRQAWDSGEGDPWRPAVCEQQSEQSRATAAISVVGGDVGTAHIREKTVGPAHTEEEGEQRKRTKTLSQEV